MATGGHERATGGHERATGDHEMAAADREWAAAPRAAAAGSVRGVRILYVCTANICRSASAAHLLREAMAGSPGLLDGIEVRSAGTAAMAGSPGCSLAPALVGRAAEHRSQPLTADLVAWADLILPAARDHRPAILALEPRARTRTFTIRQAGRIADWLVDVGMVAAAHERTVADVATAGPAVAGGTAERRAGAATVPGATEATAEAVSATVEKVATWAERFAVGDPRREVEVLPADLAQRWPWIVREMDAARGLVGSPLPDEVGRVPVEAGRRFRLGRAGRSRGAVDSAHRVPGDSPGSAGRSRGGPDPDPNEMHPDDVPDPHVLGARLHPRAYEQIRVSTDALVRLLREVSSTG